MSKLTKFFKHPVMFFEDAAKNKKIKEGKPKIFVVGFSTWKTYLRMYFSEYDLIFLPKDIKKSQFNSQYRKKILSLKESCQVFIWGFKAPEYILEFLREEKVSTKFVEDGFVRSVQLGATKAPPMSLCLDSKTPYFDATRPSDLEDLLNNFDFTSKPELLDQAKEGIKLLLETGVSKYNNSQSVNIEKIYGPKTKKRILVLGQVEDDASIQYGCEKKLTNNDVVRLAVKENPDAQVIYKPHPDVMNGHRPYQSNPADVEDIAMVLAKDVPLADAFETVDHIYTITSLGGFEALIRGIKVTTLGCPFYSGWGITDDRQLNVRRNKKLTVEQVFAISYIVYPTYFKAATGKKTNLQDVINEIKNNKIINFTKNKSKGKETGKLSVVKVSEDEKSTNSNKAYLLYFGEYKRGFYSEVLNEYDVYSIDASITKQKKLSNNEIIALFNPKDGDIVVSWSRLANQDLIDTLNKKGVKFYNVEDAFVRSVFLADAYTKPISYIMDDLGIYFDASKESRLERILNEYDFEADTKLMERARAGIESLVSLKITKYNLNIDNFIDKDKNLGDVKKILVVGQVEDDASIRYGCSEKILNNDLVSLASRENPDAHIIYKPHPDVLFGHRERLSDPQLMESIATVLYEPVDLFSLLDEVDHVYTITSLLGFEALLRGKQVTTIGCPFYSGWGLTDDRQINQRRNRILKLEHIFAGAYILYSNYYDPWQKKHIEFEEALKLIVWMKNYNVFSIDKLPEFNLNKVLSKSEKSLNSGNLERSSQYADVAIAGSGSYSAYLARARIKIRSGIVDFKLLNDLEIANKLSNYESLDVLILSLHAYLNVGMKGKFDSLVLDSLYKKLNSLSIESTVLLCVAFAYISKDEKVVDILNIRKDLVEYIALSELFIKTSQPLFLDEKLLKINAEQNIKSLKETFVDNLPSLINSINDFSFLNISQELENKNIVEIISNQHCINKATVLYGSTKDLFLALHNGFKPEYCIIMYNDYTDFIIKPIYSSLLESKFKNNLIVYPPSLFFDFVKMEGKMPSYDEAIELLLKKIRY